MHAKKVCRRAAALLAVPATMTYVCLVPRGALETETRVGALSCGVLVQVEGKLAELVRVTCDRLWWDHWEKYLDSGNVPGGTTNVHLTVRLMQAMQLRTKYSCW